MLKSILVALSSRGISFMTSVKPPAYEPKVETMKAAFGLQ